MDRSYMRLFEFRAQIAVKEGYSVNSTLWDGNEGLASVHQSSSLMEFDESQFSDFSRNQLRRLRGHLAEDEKAVTTIDRFYLDSILPSLQKDGPMTEKGQARRRIILEAVGNCTSIQELDEHELFACGLMRSELETVLYPLQLKSLRKLTLRPGREYCRDCDSGEIRGKLWGQLLEKSQTLPDLTIWFSKGNSSSPYLCEIVSGLSGNPHPAIEKLSLRDLERPSDTIYISQIIRCTTKLRHLKFRECDHESLWLSTEAVGALASSIAAAVQLNLDSLIFKRCSARKGLSDNLLKMFAGGTDSDRRYLPSLHFTGVNANSFSVEFWEALPYLLGSCVSAITVQISGSPREIDSPTLLWWRAFANAVKLSGAVCITIYQFGRSTTSTRLEARWGSSPQRSLEITLETWVLTHGFSKLLEACDDPGLTIELSVDVTATAVQGMLSENLRSNSSIRKLALPEIPFVSEGWWKSIFDSLKSNRFIKCLDLRGCHLSKVDFEALMSLLRVNFTIEEVELQQTSWRDDGKAALVWEALARNKKQATHFSILKDAGFEFDQAKVGRIFLCGSPYAGKTQIKLSMMRVYHKRSRSESKPGNLSGKIFQRLKMLELRRTRGAEVELLINTKEGQVSVWDLAGQYIFRALHDVIFPRTNQSLLFVFVFNPFQERNNLKKNVYETFRLELEEWLKFIASNCQMSHDQDHLPQILVVITHKDWIVNSAPSCFDCGSRSQVEIIMVKLQSIFQGIISLLPHVYHIDAHSKKEVKPFVKFILEQMNNWSRHQAIPVVCSHLSSKLMLHSKSFNASPVWSLSTFYSFSRVNHETLKNASLDVLYTIASYLHDVGRIIIVPKGGAPDNGEPWVIVDPNWCTENFLGAMIAQGHHFNVHNGGFNRSADHTTSSDLDGFIDESEFKWLLRSTQAKEDTPVENDILEELLQGADLCYKFQAGASCKYFIPIICGGLEEKCDVRRRTIQLRWSDGHNEGYDQEYLGYRLHCEDTIRTCFNKAFFSRFQINFRQTFMRRFGIQEAEGRIHCSLGLMKLVYDSYIVFIESDEVNGHDVDIMVKSSHTRGRSPKTRIQIVKFVKEHILRELQMFCASPNGCPGIQLTVNVLRTKSVEMLIPIHERRGSLHSVGLKDLKSQFRLSIESTLQDMEGDIEEDSLLNFQYSWRDGESEYATDILDHEDLVDVLANAQEKVKRSEAEVYTSLGELQGILASLRGETNISAEKCSSINSSFVEGEAGNLAVDGSSHPFVVDDDTRNFPLLREIKFLGDKVDKVGNEVAAIGRKIEELTSFVHTQFQELKSHFHKFRTGFMEMQSAMMAFNSKVDKLIGYSKSREDHSCPRRPYFSLKDSNLGAKVKSYILQGQAVRLHFLCEARNRPHVVQGQSGLQLVITEKEMSWVPYISEISLKLISTLISVGIQLTTGVQIKSEALQFSNLNAGRRLPMSHELLEHLKQDGSSITTDPEDPQLVKAWSLLHKHLENLTYSEYRNSFGLCQVRYKYSNDPYAWICDSCVEEGIKKKVLDVCPPQKV